MASLKLANIFQSNMVVQQNKPLKIWGTAIPSKKISVKVSWSLKEISVVTDSNGNWMAKIKVPKVLAGDYTKHILYFTCEKDYIELDNILIGEIWLAGGQSNMQFRMHCEEGKSNGVVDYEREIALANFPNIRMFYVQLNFKSQPYNEVVGKWQICSPETIGPFSGVAYYFARELYFNLNIPIGIILSNIGASKAEAWVSREALVSDSVLNDVYLKSYDECCVSKEPLDDGFTWDKVRRPTLLYNAMIYPLKDLNIQGVIWYHGELNRNDRSNYSKLIKSMIISWRKDFQNEKLPIYFVQVPPYFWDNEDQTVYDYAIFREAQTCVRELKNTELAVLIDSNEPKKLHPRNKKVVGVRLANIALHKNYNFNEIAYLGPQVKSILISNKVIQIKFSKNSIGFGLTTSDNQPPKHFYVSGKERVFHEANATIQGDSIFLKCDKVSEPVAVRYAFTNAAVSNLINKDGLPAEPFRTDNWEKTKIVTIVNNKPGVGKTTLTTNLSIYFASKSFKVAVGYTDLIGNFSLLNKHEPQLSIDFKENFEQLEKLSYDIIVVDTPSNYFNHFDKLIAISDFVLVPIIPDNFHVSDINIARQILAVQSRHTIKAGIAMNRVKTLRDETLKLYEYLKYIPFPLMETVIHERSDYRNSFLNGDIINTTDVKEKFEIVSLAEEILKKIG